MVLYLQSQTREAHEIPNFEKIVDSTERKLCACFARVTSYPAMGCYRRDSGETRREPFRVLECYCEAGDLRDEATLGAFFIFHDSPTCRMNDQGDEERGDGPPWMLPLPRFFATRAVWQGFSLPLAGLHSVHHGGAEEPCGCVSLGQDPRSINDSGCSLRRRD